MTVEFITSEGKEKALTLTSPRYPPYQRNEDYAGGVGSGGGAFLLTYLDLDVVQVGLVAPLMDDHLSKIAT